MKDEYGRKLQCPKCNSKNIGLVRGSEGKPSELLYCESCGMIGSLQMFRAIPSSENPSRRDSDIEDPNEPRAKDRKTIFVNIPVILFNKCKRNNNVREP
jgi:hypothetical protein